MKCEKCSKEIINKWKVYPEEPGYSIISKDGKDGHPMGFKRFKTKWAYLICFSENHFSEKWQRKIHKWWSSQNG